MILVTRHSSHIPYDLAKCRSWYGGTDKDVALLLSPQKASTYANSLSKSYFYPCERYRRTCRKICRAEQDESCTDTHSHIQCTFHPDLDLNPITKLKSEFKFRTVCKIHEWDSLVNGFVKMLTLMSAKSWDLAVIPTRSCTLATCSFALNLLQNSHANSLSCVWLTLVDRDRLYVLSAIEIAPVYAEKDEDIRPVNGVKILRRGDLRRCAVGPNSGCGLPFNLGMLSGGGRARSVDLPEDQVFGLYSRAGNAVFLDHAMYKTFEILSKLAYNVIAVVMVTI